MKVKEPFQLPKKHFESGNLSANDAEIGKYAFKHFGAYEKNITTEYSEEFGTNMPLLEHMLNHISKIQKFELIENTKLPILNSIKITPDEWKFKKEFIDWLPRFIRSISKLPRQCKFGPSIDVFIELSRLYMIKDCVSISYPIRRGDLLPEEIKALNNFYSELVDRISSVPHRKKVRNHRWQIELNARKFESYVDSMFQSYARLVVLRLDLEYSLSHKPTIDEAKSDFARFISNQRHNKLFHALLGYIVKLEFGITNGFHFHTILFFDGSKRSNNSDCYLANQIGEYWKNVITNNRGRYWNSNGNKDIFDKIGRLGIGTIHANESPKIENLKYMVRYLCKSDQFVRPVSDPKFKTIRKGKTPILKGQKLGRPRSLQPELTGTRRQ